MYCLTLKNVTLKVFLNLLNPDLRIIKSSSVYAVFTLNVYSNFFNFADE